MELGLPDYSQTGTSGVMLFRASQRQDALKCKFQNALRSVGSSADSLARNLLQVNVNLSAIMSPLENKISANAALGINSSACNASWTESIRASSEARPANQKIILLVEDDRFVRSGAQLILSAAGHVVLVAQNAIEARQVFADHAGSIDLLLSDIVLPGESGCELARELRSQQPQLTALFMTGYADQMQNPEWSTSAHLSKPFSSSALLAAVRKSTLP